MSLSLIVQAVIAGVTNGLTYALIGIRISELSEKV